MGLLFTAILQTLAGYACPSVLTINTKIAENRAMRFSLPEGPSDTRGEVFFRYKARSNKIKKFYEGNSTVDRFSAAYYFPDTSGVPGSLTCTYKQADNKFFILVMPKRKARRIDDAMIANDVNSNWRLVPGTGFYACGKDRRTLEDACQFSLKPS
ncbi:MAG: hypothetical protein RLY40_1386 [Pseudomonadota bacterium]